MDICTCYFLFIHVCQTVGRLVIQLTLPKSNSHKSNNRRSRRSVQVLFSFISVLPHVSQIFFKSKLFLQSQWIQLRQSWLYKWMSLNVTLKVIDVQFLSFHTDLNGFTDQVRWSVATVQHLLSRWAALWSPRLGLPDADEDQERTQPPPEAVWPLQRRHRPRQRLLRHPLERGGHWRHQPGVGRLPEQVGCGCTELLLLFRIEYYNIL